MKTKNSVWQLFTALVIVLGLFLIAREVSLKFGDDTALTGAVSSRKRDGCV